MYIGSRWLGCMAAALMACSSFESESPQPAGSQDAGPDREVVGGSADESIKLADVPSRVFVVQGKATTVRLRIQRSIVIEDRGPTITLRLVGLPPDVAAEPIKVRPEDTELVVTIGASGQAKQGETKVTIEAVVDGSPIKTTSEVAVFVRGPIGSLDTTFGDNGYFRQLFSAGASQATTVDVHGATDGSALVCGDCFHGAFCCARLDPKGQLDTTYGTGGRAVIVRDNAFGYYTSTLLPDGAAYLSVRELPALVCRLGPKGAVDASFGENGCVEAPFLVRAMAAHPDGGLTVASNRTGPNRVRLSRFSHDGLADTSFNSGAGFAEISFQYEAAHMDGFGGLVIRKSGALLGRANWAVPATGERGVGFFQRTMAGTPDPAFNGTGEYSTTVTPGVVLRRVLEKPDGKLIALFAQSKGADVNGYLADGSYDAGFIRSFTATKLAGDPTSFELMPDGKALMLTSAFELFRFMGIGTPDPDVGAAGIKIAVKDIVVRDGPKSAFVADDRVLIVGTETVSEEGESDVFAIRIWN